MLSSDEIDDRMRYHPPSQAGILRHQALSERLGDALRAIEAVCPDGREKSLAITNLEMAKFWASAAVARNPETR